MLYIRCLLSAWMKKGRRKKERLRETKFYIKRTDFLNRYILFFSKLFRANRISIGIDSYIYCYCIVANFYSFIRDHVYFCEDRSAVLLIESHINDMDIYIYIYICTLIYTQSNTALYYFGLHQIHLYTTFFD